MGLFGKKKEVNKEEEKYTGHVGACSEKQLEVLNQLKQYIIDENLTTSDRFDDYYLLRFCRARQFKIEDVKIMFANFIKWRIENDVDNAFINYELPNIPEVQKVYKYGNHGTDREGRPFYIDFPCTAAPIENLTKIASTEELKRNYIRDYEYLLHVKLPACSAAAGRRIDTSFSLIDLNGLSMGMFKEKSREFLKIPMGITQDNYPEIMQGLYIVNAPFVFKAIWAIVKGFLAEETKKKIKILGGKFHKELFKVVDPSNVPAILGGDCKCEEYGGDCMTSDKGPWHTYPGDKYGEMYKMQLRGEKIYCPVPAPTPAMPTPGAGYPVPEPAPAISAPAPVPVSAPAPVPMPTPVPAPTQAVSIGSNS